VSVVGKNHLYVRRADSEELLLCQTQPYLELAHFPLTLSSWTVSTRGASRLWLGSAETLQDYRKFIQLSVASNAHLMPRVRTPKLSRRVLSRLNTGIAGAIDEGTVTLGRSYKCWAWRSPTVWSIACERILSLEYRSRN